MSIAVAVLFFEKPIETIACVKSFLSSGVPIYILNNGSSSRSTRVVSEFASAHPQIKIFSSSRNLGVSAGRNYLIRHTDEEWLFFVDSDACLRTDQWDRKLKDHFVSSPQAEIFIPHIFNKYESAYLDMGRLVIENNVLYQRKRLGLDTNIFPGTAAIINRSLFDRLGIYDEAMFVGFEDVEMAVRAIKAGDPIRGRHIEDISLVHDHGAALTQNDRTAVLERYEDEAIGRSFSHLLKKHNIRWEHNWPRWTKKQRERMVGGRVAQFMASSYRVLRRAWR